MNHLFDRTRVDEVKARLQRLQPDAPAQWGRMRAPQAVAHCAVGMEMALGDVRPPRMLAGRLMGWFVKPLALGNDAPMQRNSPTSPIMLVDGERDLDADRRRLMTLIDRFAAGGPAGCTKHPHTFFGPMTPNQWAVLMYKHLDHHLRQFGV